MDAGAFGPAFPVPGSVGHRTAVAGRSGASQEIQALALGTDTDGGFSPLAGSRAGSSAPLASARAQIQRIVGIAGQSAFDFPQAALDDAAAQEFLFLSRVRDDADSCAAPVSVHVVKDGVFGAAVVKTHFGSVGLMAEVMGVKKGRSFLPAWNWVLQSDPFRFAEAVADLLD